MVKSAQPDCMQYAVMFGEVVAFRFQLVYECSCEWMFVSSCFFVLLL